MPTDVTAETPSGPVVGRTDGAVVRFGGVPYARAERWAAPERHEWREPLDATRPGAAPPQTVGGLDLVPGMIPAEQSEACLTAEICTTGLDGARPVLVWVPGGSYRIGAASLPLYDGSHLAAHGVVVVGLNYRLGALGWLATDGVPTNLGLRDLRAAVEWLRDAVPAFGGDPERIVLMGESAGSGCIAHLLATGSPFGHGAGLDAVSGRWRVRSSRVARPRPRSTRRRPAGSASSSSKPPASPTSTRPARSAWTASLPRRSRPSSLRWPRSA